MKTRILSAKSLAVLALTFALGNTALGQAVQINWDEPADINYGTILDGSILNATAVDISGNDVTGTGEIRYFWTPPGSPKAFDGINDVDTDGDGNLDPDAFVDVFPASGFKVGDNIDRDKNTGGVQPFDWLFLDVGNNQQLTAVFTSGASAPLTKTVTINVKKAPLTVVPKTITRNFGEEAFPGFENQQLRAGDTPVYPSGNALFAAPNPGVGGGDIATTLLKDEAAPAGPVQDRQGNPLAIQLKGSDNPDFYNGGSAEQFVTFTGFVRGENYQTLVTGDRGVAQVGENLVPTRFILGVKNGSKTLFRGAPVGTAAVVRMETPPGFKNYSVNIAGNGSMTIGRAQIAIKAQKFVKVFGEAVSLKTDDDNDPNTPDIVDPAVLLTQDPFNLNNNFRLGEAFVENILDVASNGAAVDAPAGTFPLSIFINTAPLGGATAFLDNYNIQLTDGEIKKNARPARIIATNSSRVYGRNNPSTNFQIENPAPFQLKGGAVADGQGALGDIFDSSDVDLGKFFSANPVVAHTATIVSGVGNHAITISGGTAPNYDIKGRDSGTLTITRANLLLEAENKSSQVNASLVPRTVTPKGLLPFDVFPDVLTNPPTFDFRDGAGAPVSDNDQKTMAGLTSRIEVANKGLVRTANYNVFFNDGRGSFDGFGDAPGGPSDDLAVPGGTQVVDAVAMDAARGKQFASFNDNPNDNFFDFGSVPDPADVGDRNNDGVTDDGDVADFLNIPLADVPQARAQSDILFFTGNNNIGRYTTTQRAVRLDWSPASSVTFGDKLTGSHLNAMFTNPDTGLPVTDAANGGQQLVMGTDFNITYTVDDGGALIQQNGGAINFVPLKAGDRKIKVAFDLLGPGQAKVNDFGGTSATRTITVNKRTITITPKEVGNAKGKADITFGENIPNQGQFDFDIDGAPDAANVPNLRADEIDEGGKKFSTTATAESDAGDFPLTISGLKAKNGNLNFNFAEGTFTIKKAGTAVTWRDDLGDIVYGTKLDATHLDATGPAGVDGVVTYDKPLGTLLAAGDNQQIKATFTPLSPNFNTSDRTARIDVKRKALFVAPQAATKVFGDDNPAFQATSDSLAGLIPEDQPVVSVDFTSAATRDSNVGKFDIEPILKDPNDRLKNYDLTVNTAQIEITKRQATATPVNRNMQVETNPIPFINDSNLAPKNKIAFGNLAPVHAIGGDDTAKLNALFPNLSLGTDALITSPAGTTFPIRINALGAANGPVVIGGDTLPKVNGNYDFTLAEGTLTVTKKNPQIVWNDVTTTYGQPVSRSGAARAKVNDGGRTAAINILDATFTPSGGSAVYKFKDSAGGKVDGVPQSFSTGDVVPDGFVPDVGDGNIKLEVTYTPPDSEPEFGVATKEITWKITKRMLSARIKDTRQVYGGVDGQGLDLVNAFQVEYGLLRRNGESDGDYNKRKDGSPNKFVNGDGEGVLNQQLLLFSNAQPNSPVGEYFVAVAQQATDDNYDVQPPFGNFTLFDGIQRDANNPSIILGNTGTQLVANADAGAADALQRFGRRTSFTGDIGPQIDVLPDGADAGNEDDVVNIDLDGDGNADTGPLGFHAGRLEVFKAPLTVTVATFMQEVGLPIPRVFNAVAEDPTQLKNNDTVPELFKTTPFFSTTVTSDTPPGTFVNSIFIFGVSADNYIITLDPGDFIVKPKAPQVTWTPLPDTIVYGTPLAPSQLAPSANIPGTFDFSANPEGAVLPAGVQTLMTVFTPDDIVNFGPVTVERAITVVRAPLLVTANDASKAFRDANPDFSATITGFVNNDTAAVLLTPAVLSTSATADSPPGAFPIVAAGATAANYDIGFQAGTLTVTKAQGQVALSDLVQQGDGLPKSPTVTTTPPGLDVDLTFNGDPTPPSAAGSFDVVASINNPNYEGITTGTLIIRGEGQIVFADLTQTYTGQPLAPTVTTVPAGLTVNLTFNGAAAAPTEAGTFQVGATIVDDVYFGSAEEVFTIQKGSATVSFVQSSLTQRVNELVAPQVTTDPAGLNVILTFGGSATLPTQPGAIETVATVFDKNLSGSATATFNVKKAVQSIDFPPIGNQTISGAAIEIVLNATATSGLAVEYKIAKGNAVVTDGNKLTVFQPGEVIIIAIQNGDDFWDAAIERVRSFDVVGEGVPTQFALSSRIIAGGGLGIQVEAAPGSVLAVQTSADLINWVTVASVIVDENGVGEFEVAELVGDALFFRMIPQTEQ